MGLSWQQGPLSSGAAGRFLVPTPMPERLLYVERLRRRLRVRFAGSWIADSERVVILFEPGRYPVAYFPEVDIVSGVLERTEHTTHHRDLGATAWYIVKAGEQRAARGAWQHVDLPTHASDLRGHIAFSWAAMDAFFEEDDRILGHAADSYHRLDIRNTSRHLTVKHQGRMIADTNRPLALYESGFAPRWYVPAEDIDMTSLTRVEHQTFCPYKGVCSYYDIGDAHLSGWSYPDAYQEVERISGFVSFEPDIVSVELDGKALQLEPGQAVVAHGPDRHLSVDEGQ